RRPSSSHLPPARRRRHPHPHRQGELSGLWFTGKKKGRNPPFHSPPLPAAATRFTPQVNEDEHSGAFLRWLRSKAGSGISSVLRIGTSPLGRSLFASQPIQEGDCILQLPHTAQLTQDKLPREVRLLLDDDAAVAGDTAAKVAVLLMMEQRLGHESGWAPYVTSLPAKDQMHNMMFWDLDELDMVRHSPVYDEAIKQKEQVRKQFSAAKPALEHFPHLFEEIKLEDFMHSSALVSSRAWQTSRGVSLISLTMMVLLILY
uniref:SET domain-containing protein n=1 Tax=Triticum urartu TaxID=4572 RepID=A0A8R7U213_TRIUA